MNETLRLPAWKIPPAPPKPITPTAFHRWATHNFVWMNKAGLLAKVLSQPSRQPVEARFILKP